MPSRRVGYTGLHHTTEYHALKTSYDPFVCPDQPSGVGETYVSHYGERHPGAEVGNQRFRH